MTASKKKCPHLRLVEIFSCMACDMLYMPSIFELEEYCWKPMHERCPFYMGAGIEDQTGAWKV